MQINGDFQVKSFGGKLCHKLFFLFFLPFLLTNSSTKSLLQHFLLRSKSPNGDLTFIPSYLIVFCFRRILNNRNADGRFEPISIFKSCHFSRKLLSLSVPIKHLDADYGANLSLKKNGYTFNRWLLWNKKSATL